MTGESNPPKRRGCFFYGCLSLAIVGLLLLVLGGVAFYLIKKTTARWINDYTETTPTPVEKVEYSPAQMEALQARLITFKQALDKGDEPTELTLTADDLNALIARQPDLAERIFVRIEDDKVKGHLSLPLQDLGPLKLKGRYLNGVAIFNVALENGVLDARLRDVLVNDRPLPGLLLSELKKQNLAQNFQNDPKTAADIAKFESVRVTNGAVILRNKASGDGAK